GSRFEPPREVFRDLSLTVSRGECLGLLGREGTGKTTLLNLLGGLVPPGEGRILIDGVDPHAGRHGRESVRLRLGFTFQFPEEQFLSQSVEEEFRSLLRLRGVSASLVQSRMDEALAAMGLDPRGVAGRSPYSLSLGESRRLALALLVAVSPGAALLDEPTAGLDASGVACALRALGALLQKGATVIVATHDVDLLAEVAQRVVILGGGGIAADGAAGDILTDESLLAGHGYALPEVVSIAAGLRGKGKLDARRVLRVDELLACPGILRASPSGDTPAGGGGVHDDGGHD
ncbi:MAG TPA: ABC transporter ATP-binding protein, partial [Bacteroidota bacterium]|nr:ABC transporter ATP-binding protein [Bacteroidota bacterium]